MTADHQKRAAVLHLLANTGPQTRADVQRLLGLEHGATVRHLTALERGTYVFYDPTTDLFTITEHGRMRINRRKNTMNSGAGAKQGTGAPAPGANVVHMDREVERLTVEMYGAGHFALETVQQEADLWESLSAALADGMTAPDLLAVPRRRRVEVVEAALNEWQKKTRSGPCAYCGTRVAQPGWDAWSYSAPETEPAFTVRADGKTACDWCGDYLAAHSADELREAVGNAVAGTVGTTAGGAGGMRYVASSGPQMVPFAHEFNGGTYGTTPWGHLAPEMLDAIRQRAERLVHPSRFAKTEGQRDRLRVPGIEVPPVRTGRRHPAPVAPTAIPAAEPTYRDKIRAAEKRHAAERIAFMRAHPHVRPTDGGTPTKEDETPFVSSWPAAAAWDALLEKHHAELVAIDRQHPKRGDGRPRGARPHLGQASAAGLR